MDIKEQNTKEVDGRKYCNSITRYQRYQTREVMVGNIGVGGGNPIRIQSMTTVDTMDTRGSVEQSIRMIEAGCEIVRLTAPSKRDAENLAKIKEELRKRGYDTPLVADIHFTPNAAEIAARIVEKVRVNPGNYADKKKFQVIEYSEEQYREELERISEKFSPLVKICKQEGTAMRIGTNHGSLSDRIMSRYGDTPLGMVESALEFVRICEKHDYHDIILSMKASNPQVMVQAYRLLVHKMMEEGMNYPLHLGVTEAGEGEDGRIKSSVGIGTLLEDGLGDTIRVSLTEEPEVEVPVAYSLAGRYENRPGHKEIEPVDHNPLQPFSYEKRDSISIGNIGGKNAPVVVGDLSVAKNITPASFFGFGYNYSFPLDKWNIADFSCDYIFTGHHKIDFEIPGTLALIVNADVWPSYMGRDRIYPFYNIDEFNLATNTSEVLNFVEINDEQLHHEALVEISKRKDVVLVLSTSNEHGMAAQRRVFIELINNNRDLPVIIKRKYRHLPTDKFQLYSATDMGGLLIDGMGDGVWMDASECGGNKMVTSTAFGILQATRTRISRTEYISCPSCGRTLFDLQETTAKIRERTNHLKGVKIGIMGCIVNGPGEMADADYGYVGTGKGKITLYKEKEVVKRNVPSDNAVDELIELIREHGDWTEPA